MVGYKVCDRLTETEDGQQVHVTALGEEPRPAYDRVHLSEYFSRFALHLIYFNEYLEANPDLSPFLCVQEQKPTVTVSTI